MDMINLIKTLSLCLSMAVFFSSCLGNSTIENSPQYYAFVTAHHSSQEGNSVKNVSLLTDTDKELIVTNDASLYKKVKDGQRAVAYFDLTENGGDLTDNLPVKISLVQIDTAVVIGKTYFVDNEQECKKIGDSTIDVNLSPYFPSITPKYVNLYVGVFGGEHYQHSYSLVYVKDDPGSSTTLNLTFAHNTNGYSAGYEYWHWVSIPYAEFNSLVLDKEAVDVRIKTAMAGTQKLTFKLKDQSEGQNIVGYAN